MVVVGRTNVVLATALLGLGLAGIALAGVSTGSSRTAGATEVNVVVMDGKLTVSPLKLTAGKVTLVAVNKGKLTHGLAIMGNGLPPKRTPTIAVGKIARLTVTLKAGMYHVWDPVRSSMSHAKYLTVGKAATSVGSGSSASGSSGGVVETPPSSGSGGGVPATGMDPGMDGMDGMEH
jgi:hypothetical protein